MCAYTYRRELKKPGQWMGIDFGNAGIASGLQLMNRTL